jgi:hypothetical protein
MTCFVPGDFASLARSNAAAEVDMRVLAFALLTALGLSWLVQSDAAFARFAGAGAHGAGVLSFSRGLAHFHRPGHAAEFRMRHSSRFEPFLRRHAPLGRAADGMWLWPLSFGVDALSVPTTDNGDGPAEAARFYVDRPSCRLQREYQVVPSENGGETRIGITRCVIPLGYRDLVVKGQSIDRPTNSEAVGDVTSSIRRTVGDTGSDVSGCRIESRSVPAEGGGERTITVRRC